MHYHPARCVIFHKMHFIFSFQSIGSFIVIVALAGAWHLKALRSISIVSTRICLIILFYLVRVGTKRGPLRLDPVYWTPNEPLSRPLFRSPANPVFFFSLQEIRVLDLNN